MCDTGARQLLAGTLVANSRLSSIYTVCRVCAGVDELAQHAAAHTEVLYALARYTTRDTLKSEAGVYGLWNGETDRKSVV